MPLVQIGPRFDLGYFQLRPYVKGAFGGYQIVQSIFVQLNGNDSNIYQDSDLYLGAAGAVGLSVNLPHNSTVSIEGRYDRVFSPGQTLAFWTPLLQFGYRF